MVGPFGVGRRWIVVESTVVWMVPLRAGGGEHHGTLTLEPPNLVFVERRDGERVEIPLDRVRKVRRVRGSPILRLAFEGDSGRSEVAFYFTQPPPLRPAQSSRPRFVPGPIGSALGDRTPPERTTKKVMRTNVGYLTQASATVRDRIEAWVRAIREASRSG